MKTNKKKYIALLAEITVLSVLECQVNTYHTAATGKEKKRASR